MYSITLVKPPLIMGVFLFLYIDIIKKLSYIFCIIEKNMTKINVLVLPSDTTGVGKFRSVDPHVMLQNM